MSYQLYIAKITLFCITCNSHGYSIPASVARYATAAGEYFEDLAPVNRKIYAKSARKQCFGVCFGHNSPKFSPAAGLAEGSVYRKPVATVWEFSPRRRRRSASQEHESAPPKEAASTLDSGKRRMRSPQPFVNCFHFLCDIFRGFGFL